MLIPNLLKRQFTVTRPNTAGPTIHRELVLDGVLAAVRRRRRARGTLIHSDQGTQYGSDVAALLSVPSTRTEHEMGPNSRPKALWTGAPSTA